LQFTFFCRANSCWQNRRAVLTKEGLYFSLVGEEAIKDHIPLHEMSDVFVMAENEITEEQQLEASTVVGFTDQAHPDKTPALTKSSTNTTYRFFHAFQIDTILDGYNSGRSYHIRAESMERCDSVAATIASSSKKARKAAMKASRFQKSQQMVLPFHTNVFFQSAITSLILLVSFHRIAPCSPESQPDTQQNDETNALPTVRTLRSTSTRHRWQLASRTRGST
jgi:hypothetical protein